MASLQNVLSPIVESNAPLSVAQESFIDAFPLPVHQTLKTAVQTNQAPVAKTLFADISARAYAFGLMSDLYQMVNSNVHLMETLIDRQSGAILFRNRQRSTRDM